MNPSGTTRGPRHRGEGAPRAATRRWRHRTRITLEDLYTQIQEGEVKELNVVLKSDVQGSEEAVRQSLVGIGMRKSRWT